MSEVCGSMAWLETNDVELVRTSDPRIDQAGAKVESLVDTLKARRPNDAKRTFHAESLQCSTRSSRCLR